MAVPVFNHASYENERVKVGEDISVTFDMPTTATGAWLYFDEIDTGRRFFADRAFEVIDGQITFDVDGGLLDEGSYRYTIRVFGDFISTGFDSYDTPLFVGTQPVPEPAAASLLSLGLLVGVERRPRRGAGKAALPTPCVCSLLGQHDL
ncbi:MAG: hypothetical protein AAGI68_01340 [Planctomycetota bacterium]